MKRAIIALSILCTGALAINPISNITFAQNKTNKEITQEIENNKNENLNIDKNENKVTTSNKEIHKEVVSKKEEIVKPKEEETVYIEENKTTVEEKEEVVDKSTVEVIDILNQEQAKELLNMINPDIDYIYQGDETSFEALTQRGLGGYVFLPDVDGDMGLFVDKNTANVYYFHPSGYLELAL